MRHMSDKQNHIININYKDKMIPTQKHFFGNKSIDHLGPFNKTNQFVIVLVDRLSEYTRTKIKLTTPSTVTIITLINDLTKKIIQAPLQI
jgi:hypothetical protein